MNGPAFGFPVVVPRRCPDCDAPVMVWQDGPTLDDRAAFRGQPHGACCTGPIR